MQLEGPDVGHSILCYRGQPCIISGVRGLNIVVGDRVSVFQKCGARDLVQGLPGSGRPLPLKGDRQIHRKLGSARSLDFSWIFCCESIQIGLFAIWPLGASRYVQNII